LQRFQQHSTGNSLQKKSLGWSDNGTFAPKVHGDSVIAPPSSFRTIPEGVSFLTVLIYYDNVSNSPWNFTELNACTRRKFIMAVKNDYKLWRNILGVRGQGVKLPLSSRSEMKNASPYTFMRLCLTKHGNNFHLFIRLYVLKIHISKEYMCVWSNQFSRL
jgi:hypothetical protein